MSNEIEVRKNQYEIMATRLNVEPGELSNIIMNTLMPAKVIVTAEQVTAFLMVANEYDLNPITKQIYAFPAKGGGIMPIVGIDGWIKIAQRQRDYNGFTVEFSETRITQNGKEVPEWCKVLIHLKDKDYPVESIEYMDECVMNTDPWRKKPRRMLQHKAFSQAVRYAFGICGIADEQPPARDITPTPPPPVATQSQTLDGLVNQDAPTISREEAELIAFEIISEMVTTTTLEDVRAVYGRGWAGLEPFPDLKEAVENQYNECSQKLGKNKK